MLAKRVMLSLTVVVATAMPLRAQPRSYDPFQFDWGRGRWRYVPIPYDPEPAGPNYDPYRFNWHSGRWNYVPFPMADSFDTEPPSFPAGPIAIPGGANPVLPNAAAAPASNALSPVVDELGRIPEQPRNDTPPPTVEFKGRIVDVRVVNRTVELRPEILFSLKNPQGKTMTVNVGPRVDMMSIDDLGAADLVNVSGYLGVVGGRQVLIADWISADGQSQVINRAPQDPATSRLAGRVTNVREVAAQRETQTHLLITLRTSGGASALVDLGPAQHATQSAPQIGEKVQVSGRFGTFNQAPALIGEFWERTATTGLNQSRPATRPAQP